MFPAQHTLRQDELSNQREHLAVFGCVEDELMKRPRLEALVEFVGVINQNIRDVQLEIRKSVDENTGDCFYVLVCSRFAVQRLYWLSAVKNIHRMLCSH